MKPQQIRGKPVAALSTMIMLVLTGPAAASSGTTIYSDDGGYVFRYAEFFDAAAKPIRILGSCESACTLALHYPDTCAGPQASFVFHAPYNTGHHHEAVTEWVMRRFLPPVRAWLSARGGLTARPIRLEGTALRRLVRRCAP